MLNPAVLFKIKGAWDTFSANHPKFPLFIKAVQQSGIKEESIIEIAVVTPEGKRLETNVKLTASDMELIEILKNLE
ncbi:MAG: hypothetical protein K2K96_11570 [Lachnospiraceae bacterium]|nr:hypothetical protein [Lachnospiraceae bacterium]